MGCRAGHRMGVPALHCQDYTVDVLLRGPLQAEYFPHPSTETLANNTKYLCRGHSCFGQRELDLPSFSSPLPYRSTWLWRVGVVASLINLAELTKSLISNFWKVWWGEEHKCSKKKAGCSGMVLSVIFCTMSLTTDQYEHSTRHVWRFATA